ncbi:hypothetical protein BDW22DRAFT_39938 [Trametopsis cervina]|nr:hypothetical protein BDW22DRAFT_39938 [Trametopsis cervina]
MRFSLATLAALAPFVNALTFTVPNNITSGGTVTITWTQASGDPDVWSLFLVNQVFHNTYGIANNVKNSDGTLTLNLPAVPVEGGYTLEATNITDVNQVFTTSNSFSIAAPVSTSASSTIASTASSSGSVAPTSGSTAPPLSSASVSDSLTAPAPSSPSSAGSLSSTSSSPSASPSTFNGNTNGAITSNPASWLALIAAALAGSLITL